MQTFYRCEEGYKEAAAKVIEAECRCLLRNMRHEAATKVIEAKRGVKKTKAECRAKYLKKEKYLMVITYS